MKAILEFNLPDDSEEFKMTSKASAMSSALFNISNEVFRPARKHGYNEADINALLEKLGSDGYELISLLEQKFFSILEEHDVKDQV